MFDRSLGANASLRVKGGGRTVEAENLGANKSRVLTVTAGRAALGFGHATPTPVLLLRWNKMPDLGVIIAADLL